MSLIDLERYKADLLNQEEGHLTGYDCPRCKNRGVFYGVDDQGRRLICECRCMAIRRSRERLKRSGLSDMASRYTLASWEAPEGWQRAAKKKAEEFISKHDGWWLMAGSPGTGKTHLCTAICLEMINAGVETRYMLWRDVSTRAKAVVNDEAEYDRIVGPLKTVGCLYIDDLFKTGKGQEPTTADVNLAFEILNARYNDSRLITVISTERSLDQLLAIDEAVGSRIYERSKEYYLPLGGKQNWRLR